MCSATDGFLRSRCITRETNFDFFWLEVNSFESHFKFLGSVDDLHDTVVLIKWPVPLVNLLQTVRQANSDCCHSFVSIGSLTYRIWNITKLGSPVCRHIPRSYFTLHVPVQEDPKSTILRVRSVLVMDHFSKAHTNSFRSFRVLQRFVFLSSAQ